MNLKKIGRGIVCSAVVITISFLFFVSFVNYYNLSALYDEVSKPSYEYLTSVTVMIHGSAKSNIQVSTPDEKFYYNTPIINSERKWIGTGTIIKTTRTSMYILTNAHVAGKGIDGAKLFIEDETNKRLIAASIIKIHEDVDLAILKINTILENKRTIEGFAEGKPQDDVYVVGHHLGRPYIYGEGFFAGYNGDEELMQVPCLFGNSGSGVFNKNGELIAVVFAIDIRLMGIPVVDVAHARCVSGYDVQQFVNDTI